MIKRSLRSKLVFQYMVMVLVCMVVIPTAIAELLDRQFRSFANERLLEDEQEITEYFTKIYNESGSWNRYSSLARRPDLLRWPMVKIELFDAEGKPLRQYVRQMKMQHKMQGKHLIIPEAQRTDLIVRYMKIRSDNRVVGTLRFTCIPFNESREGNFLARFNKIMYYAVGVMLLAAAMIAYYMAGRISTPVLRVASRAQQISRGKYKIKEKMTSEIAELDTLLDSVDRLGESLESQEELRRRLLSDIAHELRNPVTIIKSHLEAIEDGVWQPTPERIRLTVSEVDRLSKLIKEVEKLTSIESAGHAIEIENINISEITERAVMVFDPLYKNKGVELRPAVEAELYLAADGGKLRQVIENLLSNALRYTDAGGTVSVFMKKEAGGIKLEVSDTGIGISEKDLPYIFERFYRTDISRTRASGGIGIGLAIVKAIVEAHSGTIKAESRPGRGSSFTVSIPSGKIK